MQGDRSSKVKVPKVKPVVASQYGPVKPVKKTIVKAPQGDVASSGGDYGMKQANRAAKSKPVVAAQRAAYKAAPVAQRRAILRNDPNSQVAKNVAAIHDARAKQSKKDAAAHDAAVLAALNSHPVLKVKTYKDLQKGPIPDSKTQGLNVSNKTLGKHGSRLVKGVGTELVHLPGDSVNALVHEAKLGMSAAQARATGRSGDSKRLTRQLVKDQTDPYVQTAKHIAKGDVGYLEDHPLSTALLASGVEGGIGRGAGKIARTLPSKTLRDVASTSREAATVPGTKLSKERRYSKNLIHKGVQVVGEKIADKVEVKPGGLTLVKVKKRTAPRGAPQMSVKDVQARANADRAAAQHRTTREVGKVQAAVRKAVGKRPSAAVVTTAQGITDATRQSLEKRLVATVDAAKDLKGTELKRNQAAQKRLKQALKKHAAADVARKAKAFQDVSHAQESEAIDLGLIKPAVAEKTRLTPHAVAEMGADSSHDARALVKNTAKQAKGDAKKAATRATRTSNKTLRDLRQAKEDARVAVARHGGVPPKEADALRRALDAREQAVTARVTANRVVSTTAKAASLAKKDFKAGVPAKGGRFLQAPEIRASLGDGVEPAYVAHRADRGSQQPLPTTRPSISTDFERSGEAVKQGTISLNGRRLEESAGNRQRVIAAAKNYRTMIDDYGYRDHHTADVRPFDSSRAAEHFAADLRKQTDRQWQAIASADGKKFHVVPKDAFDTLKAHENVKSGPLRAFSGRWRRNILAFSARWLAGNNIEGPLRLSVEHAGPRSLLTVKKLKKQISPEDFNSLMDRSGSGHYESVEQGHVSRESQDLGKFANALEDLRQKPGIRQVESAFDKYTHVVFHSLNGRMENLYHEALLGKALRDSPLMSQHTVKLSKKAISDAASGLKDTSAQHALGQEVIRMYGRYDGFPPGLRSSIALYTPFIAWTLNATKFLYHTLPKDHPVLTAVIAASERAQDDWKHDGKLETFLKRYTPVGLVADLAKSGNGVKTGESLAGLLLPQLSEPYKNIQGQEWTGDPLTGSQYDRNNTSFARGVAAAATSLIEGQIPASANLEAVAGKRLPNQKNSTKIKPGVLNRLGKANNPVPKVYNPGGSSSPTVVKSSKGSSAGPSIPDLPDLPKTSSAKLDLPDLP